MNLKINVFKKLKQSSVCFFFSYNQGHNSFETSWCFSNFPFTTSESFVSNILSMIVGNVWRIFLLNNVTFWSYIFQNYQWRDSDPDTSWFSRQQSILDTRKPMPEKSMLCFKSWHSTKFYGRYSSILSLALDKYLPIAQVLFGLAKHLWCYRLLIIHYIRKKALS